ncbi:MAG: DUF4388 domain-containing protein [Cyanobacteria bacterium SZAS LIN-2]|nr:DUF4388 domain-containing protein [Cyanobacteria bacterium SZAS LIN-2]
MRRLTSANFLPKKCPTSFYTIEGQNPDSTFRISNATACMNSTELSKHANSLGLIFDQGDMSGEPLGSAWLVDPNTVVCCAHTIVLYKAHLAALKIRFPISGKEFAVRSVTFHPKLDMKHLQETARRALVEPQIALALEKYNVAVLKIAPGVQPLNPEENKELNNIFRAGNAGHESGLGGSLVEIELALVLQTITNARKEGTVTLVDNRGRVSGRMFCKQGRVSHAYYRNLVNEMAVNQIVEHKVAGSFYFTSEEEPDWTSVAEINRPTDSLLIEAHRRLDELDKLAGIVGGPSSLFERLTPDPRLDVLPADCREFAKLVWPLLDGGTPLGFMWELCGIDDYTVYMTLQELIKTRQISYFEAPFVKAAPPIPITLGVEKALAVGDEISALWVDDPSMAPLVRTGKILGSLTEFDPAHVIHTVGLPNSASGAPVVKDDVVIGMHCGALPPDSGVGPTAGFHQMIWVESIVECLNQAGEKELVKKLTMSGEDDQTVPNLKAALEGANTGTMQPKPKPAAGVREVARIQCPKCGRSTLEVTNFCKGCGGRLLKDQTPGAKKKKKPVVHTPAPAPAAVRGPSLVMALVMAVVGVAGGLGALALMPQPHVVRICPVTIPSTRWVESKVERFDISKMLWRDTAANEIFVDNTPLCLDVAVNKPGYVYCFYRGTSGGTALLYPHKLTDDEKKEMTDLKLPIPSKDPPDDLLQMGDKFSIGSGFRKDKNDVKFQGFSFDEKVGSEKIIFIASSAKLNFLDKPDQYAKFVDTVLELLERNNSPSGLQTTVGDLGKNYFSTGDAKIGNEDSSYVTDPVYLALQQIDHGTPSP